MSDEGLSVTPVRLLIIDDSDDDALLIVTHLRRGGIELTYERAETLAAIAEALTARGSGRGDRGRDHEGRSPGLRTQGPPVPAHPGRGT